MLMNWPKELEARLADDPRLERKKSRFSEATAFFLDGKEIAHFQAGGEIDIRLTAAGIFAFKHGITHDSIVTVATDWVMIKLESEEDLEFSLTVLERAIKAANTHGSRPKGKTTRKAISGTKKSEATKAFEIAQALKGLEEMKIPKANAQPKSKNQAKTKAKAKKKK